MISPEAAAIRAGIRRQPVDRSRSVVDDRNAWEAAAAEVPLPPWANEELVDIDGVGCRIVRAESVGAAAPTIVYNHGGGFVSGSSLTTRVFGARLSAAVGATVVLVDYRLLPEHAFPAPVDDVIAVAGAVLARDDNRGVMLGGDSSGAALAVSASVVMRDRGLRLADGIVSICGAFDATLTSESVDTAPDPQLDRPQLDYWQASVSTVSSTIDPLMSPIFADLHDLPPLLLLAGGDDVWRDDSVRLAAKVASVGGGVELHVVPDMWHCWPVWGDFPESRQALATVSAFCARVA